LLVAIAGVAIAENFGLMRDLLRARVPDAVTANAILAGWLAHQGWQPRRVWLRVVTVSMCVVVMIQAAQLGGVSENLSRAGLNRDVIVQPWRLADLFNRRKMVLRDIFAVDPPSRFIPALTPFVGYVDRCTTTRHRLFLVGMIPEVAYYTHRPFAGGAYAHFNFTSAVNQQRVVAKLATETVPFVLVPSDSTDALSEDVPVIAQYLAERYTPLTTVAVPGDLFVRVLVERTLQSAPRDTATGWPCLR
jgi:hypothetical protein